MEKDEWEITRFEKASNDRRFIAVKHLDTGVKIEEFYDDYVEEDDLKVLVERLRLRVEDYEEPVRYEEITKESIEEMNDTDTSNLTEEQKEKAREIEENEVE